MLCSNQKNIRHKVGLLNLAEEPGNVSKACQMMGRNNKPVRLSIRILSELQRIINASSTGDLTYLVTNFGKPFTAGGFGNRFRKWCDDAGLSQCSAHGMRKASAARMAELGCTDKEIMAYTGHKTLQEVQRYTVKKNSPMRPALSWKRDKNRTKVSNLRSMANRFDTSA